MKETAQIIQMAAYGKMHVWCKKHQCRHPSAKTEVILTTPPSRFSISLASAVRRDFEVLFRIAANTDLPMSKAANWPRRRYGSPLSFKGGLVSADNAMFSALGGNYNHGRP